MKLLMTAGFLIGSLALTGNAAMAANTQIHHTNPKAVHVTQPRMAANTSVHTNPKAVHVTQPRKVARAAPRVAARRPYAYAPGPLPFDIGQFIQSMLGGPLPPQYAQIVGNAVREQANRGSSATYDYSPSYDNSPTVDTSSAANDAQAASDEENMINQQINDTNAQTASMAAAEQENEAANAETLQTEINAGM